MIEETSRDESWKSWGSAPTGRSTTTSARSPTTFWTMSPRTVVVATTVNRLAGVSPAVVTEEGDELALEAVDSARDVSGLVVPEGDA
jgi:hypothetical protein